MPIEYVTGRINVLRKLDFGSVPTMTRRGVRRVVVGAIPKCVGRGRGSVIGRAGYSDGSAHARAADAAVTVRVLGEVLLVIVLGVVELSGVGDLGRDLAVAAGGKHRLERVTGLQRSLLLRVRRHVDR